MNDIVKMIYFSSQCDYVGKKYMFVAVQKSF